MNSEISFGRLGGGLCCFLGGLGMCMGCFGWIEGLFKDRSLSGFEGA